MRPETTWPGGLAVGFGGQGAGQNGLRLVRVSLDP